MNLKVQNLLRSKFDFLADLAYTLKLKNLITKNLILKIIDFSLKFSINLLNLNQLIKRKHKIFDIQRFTNLY